MDNQAQLVIRDQDSNYLFLETPSKKLLLPSTRVKQDEDFHAAALRYITEVHTSLQYSEQKLHCKAFKMFPHFQKLCLSCIVRGVVKIQHCTGKVVNTTQKLTVTFVAEKQSGKSNLGTPSVALRWVPLSEVRTLSSFVLDNPEKILVQLVHSGGAVYPVSLVECLDKQGLKKRYVCSFHFCSVSVFECTFA